MDTDPIRGFGVCVYRSNHIMEEFLSEETFARHVNKQNTPESPAGKWRDLATNVLYKIESGKEVTTRYGPGMILEKVTREGDKRAVWAPDRLARELRGGMYPRYVRFLGLTPCQKDPTKQYYKYELV